MSPPANCARVQGGRGQERVVSGMHRRKFQEGRGQGLGGGGMRAQGSGVLSCPGQAGATCLWSMRKESGIWMPK